jgi:hypothetical protein
LIEQADLDFPTVPKIFRQIPEGYNEEIPITIGEAVIEISPFAKKVPNVAFLIQEK